LYGRESTFNFPHTNEFVGKNFPALQLARASRPPQPGRWVCEEGGHKTDLRREFPVRNYYIYSPVRWLSHLELLQLQFSTAVEPPSNPVRHRLTAGVLGPHCRSPQAFLPPMGHATFFWPLGSNCLIQSMDSTAWSAEQPCS